MSNNIFHHEEIYRGSLDKLKKPVTICGCGAVGSNLVDNLVRQGFTNITVIDSDRVEKHNINTQVWNQSDLGTLKVNAMLTKVFDSVRQEIEVESKRLDSKNVKKLLKGASLIVDGFDNTESRQLLYNYGKETGTPVLHVGLFEDYAEIIWNDEYIVPQTSEGLDICDYPMARNIIMLATAIASEEIVRFFFEEKNQNWMVTLKDFKVTNV